MTVLNVGQLQGIFPTNEITIDPSVKLTVEGILRVSRLQNSAGLTILTSSSSGDITLPSNLTVQTLSSASLSASSLNIPTWSTSNRPSSATIGTIGFNTTISKCDVYTSSGWRTVGQTTSTSTASLPTTGRILQLDATSSNSYPGTGSVWYDTSGSNNNFNINPSAFNSAGKYMDFNGSYGCAKNGGNISLSGDVTYVTVTRIRNSTSGWRTLTRGYGGDHHGMIQDGGWAIGIYDNDSAGFISSGYSQQSLPGYSSNAFMVMIWRWTNSDNPTYSLSVNGVTVGNIVNSNARYTRGFGAIGAYHNENTDPNSAQQFWGDIKYFAAYNRRLLDSELITCYNALSSYL